MVTLTVILRKWFSSSKKGKRRQSSSQFGRTNRLKFRQGKFVEIGNISAFIGASLSLPLMRNYIKSLLEYFGDSDLFECRYS